MFLITSDNCFVIFFKSEVATAKGEPVYIYSDENSLGFAWKFNIALVDF